MMNKYISKSTIYTKEKAHAKIDEALKANRCFLNTTDERNKDFDRRFDLHRYDKLNFIGELKANDFESLIIDKKKSNSFFYQFKIKKTLLENKKEHKNVVIHITFRIVVEDIKTTVYAIAFHD